MLKNIKAVIFDLDGVVVFTDKHHYHAWSRLATEQCWDFDPQVGDKLRGVSRRESLEVILRHNRLELPPSRKEELCDRKNRYYVESLSTINESDLYPGVIDFIGKLRSFGLKTGLASSSRNAMLVLEKLGIGGLFDAIVTGGDIVNTKPDPEIFLKTSQKLGIHYFCCVVFEDAPSGVEAALAAKMKCVGVGDRELLQAAPDVITDYRQVDCVALIETGRIKSLYRSEPWAIVQTEFNPKDNLYWETIFSLANGNLGMRGSLEEEYPWSQYINRGTFQNGLYDMWKREMIVLVGDPEYTAVLVSLYDWQTIHVDINGERFNLERGTVHDFSRWLDMKRGLVEREVDWESPKGDRVKLRFSRFISLKRRNSAVIRVEVTAADRDVKVHLESNCCCVSNSIALGADALVSLENKIVDHRYFLHCSRTGRSGFHVTMALAHKFQGDPDAVFSLSASAGTDLTAESVDFTVGGRQTAVFDKHLCLGSNLDDRSLDVDAAVLAGLRSDYDAGFERMLGEHEQEWTEYWRTADIKITGSPEDQTAIRFSLYHLRQSHSADNMHSISANSLTGPSYCGRVFWDADVFMMPHFLYTQPELARSLVHYRYRYLEEARAEARTYQQKGVRFPWASLDGRSSYKSFCVQHHINADVAWAVWKYAVTSGDWNFIHNEGAEIIFETARFFSSLGSFSENRDGKFCIFFVGSPDEYAYCVDNNFYTNMMAKFNFRIAVRLYREMPLHAPEEFERLKAKLKLEDAEPERWAKCADLMYFRHNGKLGIYEQDDQFLDREPVDVDYLPDNFEFKADYPFDKARRFRVAKQADTMLLLFLLDRQYSKEDKQKNYDYYIRHTKHVSSLSPGIHCIMAARTGRDEDMVRLLRHTIYMDLFDFKKNTAAGIHSACLGTVWMAVVNGLSGMQHDETGLSFEPKLPPAWESYEFKVKILDNQLQVTVVGGKVRYQLLAGAGMVFTSSGQRIALSRQTDTVEVECPDSPISRRL